MKSLKTVLIHICLFIILCISGCVKKTEQIYGLTIDDSWYESVRIEEVVLSLEKAESKAYCKGGDVGRYQAEGVCGLI